MADQWMRLADKVLREQAQPGSSQLIRAGMMVDMAIQANPADADAWLMRKTLAQLAGDSEAAADALVKYCRLVPSDDAAGFQMILAGLASKPTAAAKTQALEQLLAQASDGAMTKALRSRVASYLASLYQNMGDSANFGKWLKVAADLDSSNTDAARMMYELAVARGGSNYAIGMMLVNMIKSSPMDDMPRQLLADLLANMGAYDEAQKQYVIASTLGIRSGGDQFLTNWMVSKAAIGQSQAVLDMIDTMGFSAGQANTDAVPLDVQTLKLVILTQYGRNDEAAQTFTQIRARLQKRVDMGDVQAALQLAWWNAAFGTTISSNFEQAVIAYAKANPDNALIQRILGWVHYRQGRYEQAADALHVLAETDPWAVYGLAKCTQNTNNELYAGYLQKVIRMAATSPVAVLAVRDLQALNQQIVVSPDTQLVLDAVDDLPVSIAMPIQAGNATTWTTLGVQVTPADYTYLDPIYAQVTLRNSSDYPLTVGPTSTVPSTMAIYFDLRRSGEPIKGVPPVRVDIGRTLCIQPRQTLTVPVRLDRSALGMVFASNPAAAFSFTATAVLDPRQTPQGGLTTGPLGSVDMVKMVNRYAVRPTPANIDTWLNEFKAPKDAISHMKLIASLCSLSRSLNKLPDMKAQANQIATAINGQFANLGSLGQAWMTLFTPTGADGKILFPNVCNGASQSDNITVRLAYLATHGKDDPAAIASAASHSDPRISAFAKALQMP
jgi:tetratricopeptide (TPR) repeat protein